MWFVLGFLGVCFFVVFSFCCFVLFFFFKPIDHGYLAAFVQPFPFEWLGEEEGSVQNDFAGG